MKSDTTHAEQRRRMKRLLVTVLIVGLCGGYRGPAHAQGNDGAWKTYMAAAAKAEESKNYEEAA